MESLRITHRAETHPALSQALARLAALRVVPHAEALLGQGVPALARQLREAVLAQVPAFAASRNPEVLPDLERHVGEHIAELMRLLAGGAAQSFEFVRAHARHRAAQRFPLEATLHAYHCGQKVLAQWILDAALAAATDKPAGAGKAEGQAAGQAAGHRAAKTAVKTTAKVTGAVAGRAAKAMPATKAAHAANVTQAKTAMPTRAASARGDVESAADSAAMVGAAVAAAVADFAMEYTGAISIIAAAEYLAHTRALAHAEGDRRTELLGILLSGYDEADAAVARLLKRAGYLEQRLSFCVALTQSTDPLEMDNAARAQRIVQALTDAAAPMSVRVLVGLRGNTVVAVFSDLRRTSGWTAPQANLAERLRPQLLTLGPAVLIGLSCDQPSTAFIPRGLHEATVALDFASVGERVVTFSDLPIRRLLIHRGAEYVQPALPAWFAALREANAKSEGALIKTLRALADADMNVQRAARDLRLHPNTVYARLERISELTGLNAQRYHDLTHLLLAADCAQA